MKPIMGQLVHYTRADIVADEEPEVAVAMILHVGGDAASGLVRLEVYPPFGVNFKTTAEYSVMPKGGYWHWPPVVAVDL